MPNNRLTPEDAEQLLKRMLEAAMKPIDELAIVSDSMGESLPDKQYEEVKQALWQAIGTVIEQKIGVQL